MHPYLTETEQERIIEIIRKAVTEIRQAKVS